MIGRQQRGDPCDRLRHSAPRKSGPSACTPLAAGRRAPSERFGRSLGNRNTDAKKKRKKNINQFGLISLRCFALFHGKLECSEATSKSNWKLNGLLIKKLDIVN